MQRAHRLHIPYWRALKAYAFAGKSFEYALAQLSYMHLEVPKADNPTHAPIYNIYEGQFLKFKCEAKLADRMLEFSSDQAEAFDIDPMYTWIKEEDNPTSPKAIFMQHLIDYMGNSHLRKIVDVCLRLGMKPSDITSKLAQWGPGVVWTPTHIVFYYRMFWDVLPMSYEDMISYLFIASPTRRAADGDPEPNPQFEYLRMMVMAKNRDELLFECRLPVEGVEEVVISKIRTDMAYLLDKAIGQKDISSIRALAPIHIKYAELAESGDGKFDEALRVLMDELEIVASPYKAQQLGLKEKDLGLTAPMSRDELPGSISDPRVTGFNPAIDLDEV